MKKDCSISCSNCKWFYTVRDKKCRVIGHVCWCWLDGIAGSSYYFHPDEQCFEHKQKDMLDQRLEQNPTETYFS